MRILKSAKRLGVLLILLVLLSACAILQGEDEASYTDEVIHIDEKNVLDYIYIDKKYYETADKEDEPPPFMPVFAAEPLPPHIIEQISGVSFHAHAPFDYSFLSYLTITHADFENNSRLGHMIVAAEIADEVLEIFREIYAARFPIAQIRLIDYYNADDYYSMAANNSVAFNFRNIAGTDRLSWHAWGRAIDINPIQNPFIRGDVVLPAAGAAYLNRDDVRPGMIVPGDAVYNAFVSRGWVWGGHWTMPMDFHHFERR